MKKYTDNEEEATSSEEDIIDGVLVIKHYILYCDVCGAHGHKKGADHFYPEEGFPEEADLCMDCQRAFYNEKYFDEKQVVTFWKDKYPDPEKFNS